MELSNTSRAADWLEQFEVVDRDTASALLDSMRFVPGGDVITGVRRQLEEHISKSERDLPIAIVPVLSMEDIKDRDCKRVSSTATAFVDFEVSQPIASIPGSEALIAHLLGELHRSTLANAIVQAPLTLETLRESKVRTLICVTDYIGSGQQVVDYVATWYRNTTIKSWCSFGWLKIVVVAFAATYRGKQAVASSSHIHDVHVVEIVPSVSELLPTDRTSKAEEICRIYAKRGNLRKPLGHRESAGLYASSFSVPNNLPAILIQRSKRWRPFFDGRSVPASLANEIGEHRPEADLQVHFENASQLRLAERYSEGHLDQRWQHHLALLALPTLSDDAMSQRLKLTVKETNNLRSSLRRLGLIDNENKVTAAGRNTLAQHRKKPREVPPQLAGDSSPYYPRYTK